MKRTTVRLEDDLMARAKAFALRNDTTLQNVIEDGLRLLLARRMPIRGRRPRIIEAGCELISADRDFARFSELRWRHPLDR